jgi:hypothetical protein
MGCINTPIVGKCQILKYIALKENKERLKFKRPEKCLKPGYEAW